jgi:hypothetical protein
VILAYNKDNPPQVPVENKLYKINLIVTYVSIEQITKNEILFIGIFGLNVFTVNKPSASRFIIPNKFKLEEEKDRFGG